MKRIASIAIVCALTLAKVLQKGMGTVMIVCAVLMLVTLLITFALKTKKSKKITEIVEE